jgi:beta-1,4-mannosyl-glycoprotein beta-1,4-N-acetylglucosaminyltransferase
MIWDVFPFFNELDLLNIRLNVHSPYVDRFVLVEAYRTHSGHPKPLFYNDNKHLFEPFNDRISHVICNFDGHDSWSNERIQLNDALRGMADYKDEDVIHFSGLDEITNFAKIGTVDGVWQIQHRLFYYYLNVWSGFWDFPKIFRGSDFRRLGASINDMRHYRTYPDGFNQACFMDCGWHFSFCGGPAKIKEKIEAYLHQEFNQPHITNVQAIAERVANLQDVLCRGGSHDQWFKKVPISEETHPKYIVENQQKFAHLILP